MLSYAIDAEISLLFILNIHRDKNHQKDRSCNQIAGTETAPSKT
jgi:hypothetical protein